MPWMIPQAKEECGHLVLVVVNNWNIVLISCFGVIK
jgi:hypothetical protein